MRLPRRALLALGAALPGPALASRRSVDLLVGAPLGSAPDLWARGLAPFLERHWPRLRVGVRNLPGRGGLAAAAALAAGPADGSLMGVVTMPLLLARAIEAAEPSPLIRLDMLAGLTEEPMVLAAAPGTDLRALSAPGPARLLGTSQPGSTAHLAALRLEERMPLQPIAFASAAAARQAALGGHVAAALLPLPDMVAALREGRLQGLGVAAPARLALLPDLPTLAEQGIALSAAARRGLALPPGVPGPMRATLLAGAEVLAADPDFAEQSAQGGTLPRFLGSEAWLGLLTRADEALRRRWEDDPWLPRRS